MLNENEINKQLSKLGMPKVIFFDEIDSTNNAAKRLKDFKNGQVLLAVCQTNGKGRYEKEFVSPRGSGIYMSVILNQNIDKPHLITAAAAITVFRAIKKVFNKKTEIKWVNDLFFGGKKVCGILCETINDSNNNIKAVIIGIGINIYNNKKLENLNQKAGALFNEYEKADASALIAEIAYKLSSFDYSSDFLSEYKANCKTLNKHVEVLHDIPYAAFAYDIDANGALLVKTESGELKTINFGEVSVKNI